MKNKAGLYKFLKFIGLFFGYNSLIFCALAVYGWLTDEGIFTAATSTFAFASFILHAIFQSSALSYEEKHDFKSSTQKHITPVALAVIVQVIFWFLISLGL